MPWTWGGHEVNFHLVDEHEYTKIVVTKSKGCYLTLTEVLRVTKIWWLAMDIFSVGRRVIACAGNACHHSSPDPVGSSTAVEFRWRHRPYKLRCYHPPYAFHDDWF